MDDLKDVALDEIEPKPELELLSVREAKRLLKLSEVSVYKLMSRGELPRVRLGGRCFVPRASLERMLEAKIAAAEAEIGLTDRAIFYNRGGR